jgi:hypothetical protein
MNIVAKNVITSLNRLSLQMIKNILSVRNAKAGRYKNASAVLVQPASCMTVGARAAVQRVFPEQDNMAAVCGHKCL